MAAFADNSSSAGSGSAQASAERHGNAKVPGHAEFVHLRVRSCYSLLEGAVRPDELATIARDMAMPAVAVCDTNNLFGVYEITDCLAKAGVQPIVGVTLSVDFETVASSQVQNHLPPKG